MSDHLVLEFQLSNHERKPILFISRFCSNFLYNFDLQTYISGIEFEDEEDLEFSDEEKIVFVLQNLICLFQAATEAKIINVDK